MINLNELADRVESGEILTQELLEAFGFDGPTDDFNKIEQVELYTNQGLVNTAIYGSLDAAKALHDEVLPGWEWEGGTSGWAVFRDNDLDTPVYMGTTWVSAILRAKGAEQ
jgi:hypothetical protein